MMDRFRQSSTSSQFLRIQIWNTNKCFAACILLLCATVSCSKSASTESTELRASRDMFRGMTESPITRIHRISNGRLNSRFLRTFPSLDFLHYARREGLSSPHDMVNGNSPVFYIRLPPAPYILVPGLGYVSPHPYNTPMIGVPSNAVMLNPMGMMMSNGGKEDDLSSSENAQNNVISLPLKFLSNGRPAQIQNPKKPPSKFHPSKPDTSKTTNLISGGKYAFNGRPSGVFIVRSPSDGSPNSIL